ncbi:hypothetical protein A1O3_03242 [Capronia epimyces CBS 606.96]|uniref:BZIP domain-containing protein n=1 Tax=Capronia epimyces CBS 606.96 TaxID=1182542 RepID=W9YCB7_9EURO|nr:uncharacterized protein A1O3_03242 [Capronia epimyces CBS 606.96]EXJ90173.1 hypothetical protein A1O3_03242 [Capronia epimyces CBS 606.96]
MSTAGARGTNKRSNTFPKVGASPVDAAQSHKAARKRSQNRISQKCLREKQLAQTQHLAAFLDMIQASRGTDDNQTALMKAHLKLLEENQQIKAALLRMRKKLLSISNSAATTADDEIFDEILGRSKDGNVEPETSATVPQTDPTPSASMSPRGLLGVDLDGAEASREQDSTSTAGLAGECFRDEMSSLAPAAESNVNEDSPSFPGFDGLGADFDHMTNILNCIDEPTFDLGSSLDLTQMGLATTGMEDAVRLSGKELADLVEWGCIIYVLQMLNIPINADNIGAPVALQQQYVHRVTDQMVANLAAIATNVLGVFAGLDAYVYGVGAGELIECIMRWRIKPTTANRLAIPEPYRPTPLQYSEGMRHPLVIDLINWPRLRDQLILLSRRSKIDDIIDDIVLHTVIEVRQIRVSLGVVDLFYSRVFPNMDCSGFSPIQNKSMTHTTLIAGPYDRAIRSITNEISLRMAQVAVDGGREPSKASSCPSFPDGSLTAKKHPLSANYGIDKHPQWKISREFADKYPSLDCSDGGCFNGYPYPSCLGCGLY